MKSLSIAVFAACGIIAASCSGNKKDAAQKPGNLFTPTDYTLTITGIGDDAENQYVYLYDYDALTSMRNPNSDAIIDSALVTDNAAKFDIKGSTAPIAMLFCEGYHVILPEAGQNTYDIATGEASGTLSRKFKEYNDSLNNIFDSDKLNAPEPDSPEYEAFADSLANIFNQITKNVITENIDNALGLYMAVRFMEGEDLDSLVAVAPHLTDSKRVQAAMAEIERVKATSPGQPYIDFAIEYDGQTSALSDYVKPGEYTLVDFWASWCGPCKRAIADLKANYENLNGLNIVGVAVWENPEDTKAWLEENPLPWDLILNAQSIPTDLYGIKGIPTLVLIGPDGTILARSYDEKEVLEVYNNAIAE